MVVFLDELLIVLQKIQEQLNGDNSEIEIVLQKIQEQLNGDNSEIEKAKESNR